MAHSNKGRIEEPTLSPRTDPENGKISGGHYLLLGILTVLNVLNMIDRQLLSSFANFVVPDLGLTNAQFGILTGMIFMLFYSIMGLFMGALADIYNRPRLIAMAVFLWSLLTAASGAAKGFVSLAIPRMLIGVGESVLSPAALSMLADKFPVAKRGFAAGLYYTGVPIGFGMSLLIAGYLGELIGWRACFYLLGGLGIVLSLVVLFISETPRRKSQGDFADGSGGIRNKLRILLPALRASPTLSFSIAGGVAAHFIFGATTYDQLWYVHERGFDRAHIAQVTGWFAVTGGVLGNICGGVGSDLWRRYLKRSRISFLFWTMLMLVPVNVYYRIAEPDSVFFWLGVFFTFFQLGVMYGPILSTILEIAPPQICSTTIAFYILMSSTVGVGVSITASGFLIDYLMFLGIDQPYSLSLLIFTLLSTCSIPAFYLANKYSPSRIITRT